MPPTENKSSAGPVIAIVIVLAVIILGGLYFWGQRDNATENTADAYLSGDTAAIKTQSSSDDVNSIEKDLNGTNVDSIGSDLNNI